MLFVYLCGLFGVASVCTLHITLCGWRLSLPAKRQIVFRYVNSIPLPVDEWHITVSSTENDSSALRGETRQHVLWLSSRNLFWRMSKTKPAMTTSRISLSFIIVFRKTFLLHFVALTKTLVCLFSTSSAKRCNKTHLQTDFIQPRETVLEIN